MMHNARLADPLDAVVKQIKEISGKTRKTDEDHDRIAYWEYVGGLYIADGVGPYIPGANLRKVLIEAARKSKCGKLIEQGLFVDTLYNPLAYDGPRTIDGLWEDKSFVDRRSVKVQSSRVMRTRAIFHSWAIDAECTYDPSLLNFGQLQEFAKIAGDYLGLGDYRPLHGRFTATVEELSDDAPARAT